MNDTFTAMLDMIEDGVVVYDATAGVVQVNAAAAGILGFESVATLLAAGPSTIFQQLVVFDEQAKRVTGVFGPATEAATRIVRLQVSPTGTERWVRIRTRPAQSPTGAPWTIITLRDVPRPTERAHLAMPGSAQSRLVGGILDAITDPFSVLDAQLRVVLANAASAKLLRSTPAAVIGKVPWDLVPEIKNSAFHLAYERALRTQKPVVIEEYFVPWERWYECSVYPLDTGLAVYTRDVTMRKRALELTARLGKHSALRADISVALSDEREPHDMLTRCCESLVDHLEVAFARVWTLDETETMLLLQASAGLYTHVDGPHGAVPVGKFKIGRIAESRRPHLTNDVAQDPQVGNPAWAAREKMVAFAGYPLLVDGGLVGVLAMFSRQILTEDTLSALAGIADTIAQGIVRRRTEIQLEQRVEDLARSNSELEQFAYVASHDLQEPLRMVASYNQLLARRYKGKLGEDADEFIGFTVEGVTRMQRLINDLLTYSRVGRRSSDRTEVAMEEVIASSLANLEASIREHHAQVTHDPLPVVIGDESQLMQLLQNLIGNAIKFHGEDPPKVHVSVARDGAGWRFGVRDNGIGIDPQYFERIFVIFQRLHPRENYPGTGIGLAICKKIVERHGGRIWVESTPEQGSTVWFTLSGIDAAANRAK